MCPRQKVHMVFRSLYGYATFTHLGYTVQLLLGKSQIFSQDRRQPRNTSVTQKKLPQVHTVNTTRLYPVCRCAQSEPLMHS